MKRQNTFLPGLVQIFLQILKCSFSSDFKLKTFFLKSSWKLLFKSDFGHNWLLCACVFHQVSAWMLFFNRHSFHQILCIKNYYFGRKCFLVRFFKNNLFMRVCFFFVKVCAVFIRFGVFFYNAFGQIFLRKQ